MNGKLKKTLLLSLAATLLLGASMVQKSLNGDREQLGLTRTEPLKNAPPVLAFTTVALGGFRGLISNALWIRSAELQEEDKYFEMAQLADWITKLEPTFAPVWVHQAWNMTYNISVKFKESAPGQYPDRWRWIERGIELLRDEGLRYNPNSILIYRELAWLFQHKLGEYADDANMYYKQQWANDMAQVFGKKKPDLGELIHPQTPDQIERALLLTNKYKLDPAFMEQVNQHYGPLEWRLPEAHAIYWAALGLKKARENPEKVKPEDLMVLRRVIYQSMQMSVRRGRLVENPFIKAFEFGQDLELIPKTSAAYEEEAEQEGARQDTAYHDAILKAHRNFLKDAVYFLYVNNRVADAAEWYKYLGSHYPNQSLLNNQTNSFPRNVSLDEYAVGRVQEDVSETMSKDRVQVILEGLLVQAYTSLAIGENDRAAGFTRLAEAVRAGYESKTSHRPDALAIAPIEDLKRIILSGLLDPKENLLPYAARAALRGKLGLEPEPVLPAPAASTNSAPAASSGPAPPSH